MSRAFPPVIGGIEKQNQEISQALANISNTDIIANRKGKYFLPLFLPYALLKALLIIHKYDVVLLGDGVLSILGYLLKLASAKPVACIVHGLDLTYRNTLYQKLWINVFLPRMDKLIAVGNTTIHQGMLRGLPASKFIFIPNGVAAPTSTSPVSYSRHDLEAFLNRKVSGPVILSLGRLVQRKGVTWFIENVVNRLDAEITYIIAGEGREQSAIQTAIRANNLQNRVLYVGGVSDRDKELLFSTADIFVQPNIEVAGDMEGFGLVVLEAAMHGLVVIASAIEGLKDAIHDGQNGFLVAAGDADAYRQKIQEILQNPEEKESFGRHARDYISKNHTWPLIARKYLDVMSSMRRERVN